MNKSLINRRVRSAIVTWMRDVLASRGWSAEQWARAAGTSPTNITRLLSAKDASLPSSETLALLASAAGSQPDFAGGNVPVSATVFSVPILTVHSIEGFMKSAIAEHSHAPSTQDEAREYATIPFRPSRRAFAIVMDLDSMLANGIRKGDVVTVEPMEAKPPVAGGMVATLIDGKFGCYSWHPPYLIPQSPFAIYVPILAATAWVLGSVIHHQRTV